MAEPEGRPGTKGVKGTMVSPMGVWGTKPGQGGGGPRIWPGHKPSAFLRREAPPPVWLLLDAHDSLRKLRMYRSCPWGNGVVPHACNAYIVCQILRGFGAYE